MSMKPQRLSVGEYARIATDRLQRALIVFCVVFVVTGGAMLHEFPKNCLAFVSIVEIGFMTWRRLK